MHLTRPGRIRALSIAAAVFTASSSTAAEAAGSIVVRCAIPQACAAYKNTVGYGFAGVTAATSGSHWGVEGADVSTNGGNNVGVLGFVVNGAWGVEGLSGTGAEGGVNGVATNGTGVQGLSTSYIGVLGGSTSYIGVLGGSKASAGVLGESSSSIGVVGESSTSDGGSFFSVSGIGLEASSDSNHAISATTKSGTAAAISSLSGNGVDVSGTNVGLIGRSDAYPMALTDAAGNNLVYVDGSGNVYSHGTYKTFAATSSGQVTTAFTTRTTTPNVEDIGSAQLVNGFASIRFDPAFAASIDPRAVYHVFLTPGGDTRGLFVANKAAGGFLVRETQGGHGNLSFDYRIVASAAGQPHERMALVAGSAAGEPRAAVVAAPTRPRFVFPVQVLPKKRGAVAPVAP